MREAQYEDLKRTEKTSKMLTSLYSPYCDFILYPSSRDPSITLAMRVLKPAQPGYIQAGTHGWHMSIDDFEHMEQPSEGIEYLTLQVDMRGRAYSTGNPDCNGWELYDVIDAVNYAREHYSEFILDPEVVYFESGSGGGGNAFALAGKFPDFFAAVNALYGISDYALWYENDSVGEFRDELDVWVGSPPEADRMAYDARSGITTVGNLLTPLFAAHGETDVRVPSEHSRLFIKKVEELGKKDLVSYYEMEGVGTRSHLGNITQEQHARMNALASENLAAHRNPVQLPRKGVLVVAGYLFTKAFSVVLDSIDKVAHLNYDLEKKSFTLDCAVPCGFTLQLHAVVD